MIVLRRGVDAYEVAPELWSVLQRLAADAGWEPAGAIDVEELAGSRGPYEPGCFVASGDAVNLAFSLRRFVNSAAADEVELPPIVALINFLVRGGFEISKPEEK
jgi:hypothetical protein